MLAASALVRSRAAASCIAFSATFRLVVVVLSPAARRAASACCSAICRC